jgi:hypothetical protein
MQAPYTQITNTVYVKEVGMILTTYTGFIQIFDNCNFEPVWDNKKSISENKGRGPMSITLLDYSEKLDM